MGMDIRITTEDIFRTYLILGLLEMKNGIPISSSEILNKIDPNLENVYVNRSINIAEYWLTLHNLNIEEISNIITRERSGYSLVDELPINAYKDFLGGFLYLNLVRDKKHTSNLNEIINKDGERGLTIITKLSLAKDQGLSINIKYELVENEINFSPKNFSLDVNKWYILGNDSNNEDKKLLLSKIISISNPF